MTDVAAPLRDGRYRLVAVLGAGGMATVYRGYDTRLKVYRAVKVLASNLAARPGVRRRFEQEATTMAQLHHRNIVMVHDVDQEFDRVFMVMELVAGGSLKDIVDRAGAVAPRVACRAARQMLDGLAVAHAAGVIHRDIKPHNVLVDGKGVPKLTDFGIAHVPDADKAMTKTGQLMGTWAYRDRAFTGVVDLSSDADLTVIGGATGDQFGRAVAAGDLDGDGSPDLFGGAPGAARASGDLEGAVVAIRGPWPTGDTIDLATGTGFWFVAWGSSRAAAGPTAFLGTGGVGGDLAVGLPGVTSGGVTNRTGAVVILHGLGQ